jgi:hypothetical protein
MLYTNYKASFDGIYTKDEVIATAGGRQAVLSKPVF